MSHFNTATILISRIKRNISRYSSYIFVYFFPPFSCTFRATRTSSSFDLIAMIISDEWYVVLQSIEALRYKPEGCGFDSRWGDWGL